MCGEHLQPVVGEMGREVRAALAATIEHKHRAAGEGRGKTTRSRVRHMVWHESHDGGVKPPQRRAQKSWRAHGVEGAQPLPIIRRDVTTRRRGTLRIIRVRHGVEMLRADRRLVETPPRRLLGQLPGRKCSGGLPMLTAGEALLLGGGDHRAVDDKCGRGIVEHRVDTQNLHIELPRPVQVGVCVGHRPARP